MALNLNQFAPNEHFAGMYVYQANLPQLHNVIISEDQSTALNAGAIVALDSASTNTDAPVVLQADVDDKIFGVVTYNPVKNSFVAGERIAIARENDIIYLPAAAAIAVGADLYFTSANKVTSTATPGDSIVGVALTPAAADGDLIQVELHFSQTASS